MNKTTRTTIFLICGLTLVAGAFIGAYCWYAQKASNVVIEPFDDVNDRQFFLDVFKQNWTWLFADPNYSLTHVLEHHSPKNDPAYYGKEKMFTLKADGKQVGIVTFHKTNFLEGRIHFLVVDQAARGKNYGRLLLKFGVDQLKKEGVRRIKLYVREDNIRARKLYDGFGFKGTPSDSPGFLTYVLEF